jgi:hypothetical protein
MRPGAYMSIGAVDLAVPAMLLCAGPLQSQSTQLVTAGRMSRLLFTKGKGRCGLAYGNLVFRRLSRFYI